MLVNAPTKPYSINRHNSTTINDRTPTITPKKKSSFFHNFFGGVGFTSNLVTTLGFLILNLGG